MDKIPTKENIILAGDFNGRNGNQPIPECTGTHVEQVTNHNRAALRDFCAFSKLKINSFSDPTTYTNLLGKQEGPGQ